jgi:hypothetical protein
MNQTPEHLLAPHKSAVIVAARELLRASGAGIAFEIPDTSPPQVIVLGPESEIGQLLQAPAREPMLGGRRKGDVRPTEPLKWNEPAPGEPRRWTILLTSENHGLVGRLGSIWQTHSPAFERIDVVEVLAGQVILTADELKQREDRAWNQALEAAASEVKVSPQDSARSDMARAILACRVTGGDEKGASDAQR